MHTSMRSIEDMLTDRFAGIPLSEEENNYLQTWIQTAEHCQELEKNDLLKNNVYAFFVAEETDYGQLWQNVVKKGGRQIMIRRWIRYAACLLLPLTLGIFIFFYQGGESADLSGNMFIDSCTIRRGSDLPALILVSGRQIILDTTDHSLVSVLAQDGVAAGKRSLHYQGNCSGKHLLQVPRGAEYRLVLSDQTVVWVNSDSELEYPVSFNGGERRVRLKGEAYFEVAKDTSHPFIVETDRAVASVLGTSFNVRDYAGEAADITLAEGRLQVALQAGKTPGCMLSPNQNVRIDAELTLQTDIEMDEYIGWRKGVISFQKKRLEEVFIRLARWYDFEYVFTDAGLKDYLFTAWFDRNDSFDVVVRRLEQTGRIRTEIKGRQVTLYNVER